MRFIKTGDIYRVIRITGSQDNMLGVCFGEDNKMEVIEWPINEGDTIRTSKEEILEQVSAGLEYKNQVFGTNYKLSKIYFVPSDRASCRVYEALIQDLINRYYRGYEFEEI